MGFFKKHSTYSIKETLKAARAGYWEGTPLDNAKILREAKGELARRRKAKKEQYSIFD